MSEKTVGHCVIYHTKDIQQHTYTITKTKSDEVQQSFMCHSNIFIQKVPRVLIKTFSSIIAQQPEFKSPVNKEAKLL